MHGAVQCVAAQPICRAFDDIFSREALRGLSASAPANLKALPPIVAMGGCAGGEWVEFGPEALPLGAGRPLLVPRALWPWKSESFKELKT